MAMPVNVRSVLLATTVGLLFASTLSSVDAAIDITLTPPEKEAPKRVPVEIIVPSPDQLQPKKLRTRGIKSSGSMENGTSNFKVNGYRNRTFVYGELKKMPGGMLEGYLYSDAVPTYVYGELSKKEKIIQAYDAEGQLYLLEIILK